MLHNICLFLEGSLFYRSQQHITELARNKSFWLNKSSFFFWTHLPNILSWKSGSPTTGVFEGESPLDQLCHSFHFTWLCVTPAVYLSHKWLQRKFWQRRLLCQITHSRVLRRHISSHLSLLRTQTCCSKPRVWRTENGPRWLSARACDVCAPRGWKTDPEPCKGWTPQARIEP